MLERRRKAFTNAVEFVLENQFVELDSDDRYIFRAIAGSGMGLECSGDISDMCFHHMVEKPFCCDSTFRRHYHVEFYGRFRDDILLVLGGTPDSRREFIHAMKIRSRFFKLKVESVHASPAVMLDLVVSKGIRYERSGCLDVSIHTKVTAQGAALSSSSKHTPSIHTSWPLNRMVHFYRVCNHRRYFRDATFQNS